MPQTNSHRRSRNRFKLWLLRSRIKEVEGPHEREGQHRQHPWWRVMCLTGVDYFSTLGYQPGIAFLAAAALSPIATFVLVLLTLFGALPIYRRVAAASPHGEGSISMLEDLLTRWKGKLFVLCLLGFVATDFVITMTMSAADATAHIMHNPFTPEFLQHRVGVTLFLLAVLGAVFLKGFREAIGIAVFLVGAYLALNVTVIGVGFYQISLQSDLVANWKQALFLAHGSPTRMVAAALLLFPRLALGLSGFETGVAVMPLVQGDPSDSPDHPAGRIRNTRKLLVTSALIMSVLLIMSSFITTVLIPADEFRSATATEKAGQANGRALAYLAHLYLGDVFGTIYDLSTALILWFAGASAMAGLLNIVPRYLPRYGMAPKWTRATRPLVLVYTGIAFVVTILFRADVDAQGGAYATGVLVLMSSSAIAVTLALWDKRWLRWAFVAISLVFAYTTLVNIYERPEGIKIASFFIGSIIFVSLISRGLRTTELRVEKIELDETAQKFIDESHHKTIRIVANRRDRGDIKEYRYKEAEKRDANHIPENDSILFFEVQPGDASEFSDKLFVRGYDIGGYRVLRTQSPAVPNAIAAFLLYLRDQTGAIPHAYFGWTEGNPFMYMVRYIALGEGDTAPVTHEVLRKAEPNPARRPAVHVGG